MDTTIFALAVDSPFELKSFILAILFQPYNTQLQCLCLPPHLAERELLLLSCLTGYHIQFNQLININCFRSMGMLRSLKFPFFHSDDTFCVCGIPICSRCICMTLELSLYLTHVYHNSIFVVPCGGCRNAQCYSPQRSYHLQFPSFMLLW